MRKNTMNYTHFGERDSSEKCEVRKKLLSIPIIHLASRIVLYKTNMYAFHL